MEFEWRIAAQHLNLYRAFIAAYAEHEFVQVRKARNIEHVGVSISKQIFWRTLVGCMLTTQQKSGKGSHVSNFFEEGHEIFDVQHCLKSTNLAKEAQRAIAKHHLRFGERIGGQLEQAAKCLADGGWRKVSQELKSIFSYTTAKKERNVGRFLQKTFKGIGPKQSRNLIQWMGLSRYEIPLDSRVVSVLRELHFPVPLSPAALSDENYYCFVEDGIHLLMERIDCYPCVFDACAFASREKNEASAS
jgi:hypothetical protein